MKNRKINFDKKEMAALFWDVNIDRVDIEKHKEYIINRILEYGDVESVRWMFNKCDMDLIKKVLYESRDMSDKSSNYWKLFFKEKI